MNKSCCLNAQACGECSSSPVGIHNYVCGNHAIKNLEIRLQKYTPTGDATCEIAGFGVNQLEV